MAVELRPNAESLVDFEHPDEATYVFGPEDGSLPKGILSVCHRFVVIPTPHCLNLAAAVNVVLYDRRLKQHQRGAMRLIEPVEMSSDPHAWQTWHEDANEEEMATRIERWSKRQT